MRWLLLSDIHAHAAGLERVLERAAGGYDEVVVLGDLVGYGPEPVATIDRVRALAPRVCLAGNHEAMLLELVAGRRPNATSQIVRVLGEHAEALGEERIAWLAALPHHADLDGFAASHATPSGAYDYLLSVPDARRAARDMVRPLTFVGHTHVPGAFLEAGGRWRPRMATQPRTAIALAEVERAFVNPGSAGAVRDPRGGVSYAVYDASAADGPRVSIERIFG